MKILRFCLFLCLVVTAFWSCSVRKNNIISRNYHGTTTHYNFYFNARERVKQASSTLAEAHEDKYDRVLSIFKIGDLNKAKGVFPDLDEAIKKASIAISRHSMDVKGRKDNLIMERNRWIPRCYLVIGQSQFYKHDFWSAIETFQFISSEYKKDEIRPEALIWLTRTYLELGKTTDAEYLLDYLKADKEFPVKQRGYYHAVLAQYHLMKKDVSRAIDALEVAASSSGKKDDRARYYFILGQLYQKSDTVAKAFSAYDKVVKLNPPYEMAFNARINRARCYDAGSGSGETVKRELQKMLKDIKNAEFLDQIYFALAGVAKQENNEPLSVELLNKSVRASSGNTTQLARSYLELGDIYLSRPDYIPAAAYYDSCLTNITTDHPEYYDIQSKRNSLDRLVKNLKVIIAEDSLLSLADMSPEEREAAIGKIVEEEDAEKERLKKEKEEKQKLEEQQIQEEKQLMSQPRAVNQPSSAAQGAWYFYNQSAISFGFNEFAKRWGNRKLEDNWRRSEKDIVSEGADTTSSDSLALKQGGLKDSIAGLDANARKNAYLAMIPQSTEQINASHAKIAEAYYNCGVIYKEQLQDYKECIRSFERLDERYPDNKYKLPSYYNLYRTWMLLKDSSKADYYKNFILNNYPESDYARLILNPDFFKDMKRKSEVLEVFYENTYRAYLNRQYDQVIERKQYADESFPADNKLAPKFAYLKAMAIGKTRSLENFQFELEDIIRRYPKDSVSIQARSILDIIQNKNIKSTVKDTAAVDTSNFIDPFARSAKFIFDLSAMHFFVIIYPNASIDASELTRKIEAFNNIENASSGLVVQGGNIDLKLRYIAVMSFAGKDEGMRYYERIMEEPGLLDQFDPELVRMFVISQSNLTELTRTKDLKAYSEFFKSKYLE